MQKDVDIDALQKTIERLELPRILVAIAGPPGVGKSTFSAELRDRLNTATAGICEILPMDGYHFDDTYLDQKNIRHRKGAPFTFDVGGLNSILARLKVNAEAEIFVPVFDRDIEIARAGARVIKNDVRIVLVEGNYLLLNTGSWPELSGFFDVTVMLHAPEKVLKSRLLDRWESFGYSAAQALEKAAGNDLLNVKEVIESSGPADFRIETAR